MSTATGRGGITDDEKQQSSRYVNSTKVEQVLNDSMNELGAIQLTAPLRILADNWVECMRDIRLLVKENEIEHLDLPNSLVQWLIVECSKRFPDDAVESGGTRTFVYAFDLDTNGICYWLGTEQGVNDWSNPGASGSIRVRMSSIMADSQPPHSIVGRECIRCVTKPEENSWFIVDFAPRRIKPSHYTLRHYSSWDTEALRYWRLEGSNDGASWHVLREHNNDQSLNHKGATATWPIETRDFYSFFRVMQTGYNSNRHYYLSISGFEIYGELQERPPPPENGLVFVYERDLDENGVLWWLGTNRGTEDWQNPAMRGAVRVKQSSLAKDSTPSYAVVGRTAHRCVTEPKKLSWFCIDLLNIRVIPTHYTLRHYSSFDTECLRNWRLEASNDSTTGADGRWITLMTHRDDRGLTVRGGTHTWAIPAEVVANQAYSKFRVLQIGQNSNQHFYLALSGFEIYGTVIPADEMKEQADAGGGGSERPAGPHQRIDYQGNPLEGIIHYMGTGAGTRPWTNPCQSGLVEITSSSLMSDSQPLSAVVGKSSVRCVTKPHTKSWIAINLKDTSVRPTHYTLRHYSSWDTEALRYWNFEGSDDGSKWTPIHQHYDDRSLRRAGAAHTWTVDCPRYFSRFRLFMTGRNSNNHWYLAVSGFDLFGDAVGPMMGGAGGGGAAGPAFAPPAFGDPAPPAFGGAAVSAVEIPSGASGAPSGSNFDFHHDMDENGLVWYLGTRGGTQAFANPASAGYVNITTSGLMNDSAPKETIVGRDSVRLVTKPTRNAHIVIHFLGYAINLTHYTLRHYSSWDTEALRNWRLEGSLDGETWVTLREHRNDTSLRAKGQAYTWRIRSPGYFSMFRLLQFDKNSNNHYYMAISGFEVYGSVVRQSRIYTFDQWPRNKSKNLRVDPTLNTVRNEGTSDAWQTVKAREPFDFSFGNVQSFSILVEKSTQTTNSWRFMSGVAPDQFTCTGGKQWLGSQGSWGYIAGTGGRCFNVGKSTPYGQKWGSRPGELVTCVVDKSRRTIEFLLNGRSQGVAFEGVDFSAPLFPAASLTAENSRVRLVEVITRQTRIDGGAAARPPASPAVAVSAMASAPVDRGSMAVDPHASDYGFDSSMVSANVRVLGDGVSVRNNGSGDTWQGAVSRKQFSSGRHYCEFEISVDENTTNMWRFIVGVAPLSFNPQTTAWLGSQGSWGFIAGTGGKCHNAGKSVPYARRWGIGDRIRVNLDFNAGTIEFLRNGRSQGIAFEDLRGPVRPAVSLTGTNAVIKIVGAE